MNEPTLENLEHRLTALELKLAGIPAGLIAPTKDWQSVVGISEMTDFSRQMLAEMEAIREADRIAAETEVVS